MSLYDILACPNCKVSVERETNWLICRQCSQKYPIINGVPVMFPDGGVPQIIHEADLFVRTTYDPWVHRTILQSLFDDQIVLEVGSGNMAIDDPNIIRMDVTLSPYVDLVADVHHLPFLPESVDYIFSLAVFEHLHNPFLAARSIYETLKDGGYIYHDCNFVFGYHGYPHHYFNASLQGLEQIFHEFVCLRKGIAPYQMPSFALDSVIKTYLRYSHAAEFEHGKNFSALLQQVLAQDLRQYDIYFSEEEALNVAAGTYYAGVKQRESSSTIIPNELRKIRNSNPELIKRFPQINQLTTIDNIMTWAKAEGRKQYPEIETYLECQPKFNKRDGDAKWDRQWIQSMPLQETPYGAMGFDSGNTMEMNSRIAEMRRSPSNLPSRQILLDKLPIQRAREVFEKEGPYKLTGKLFSYALRQAQKYWSRKKQKGQ